MSDVFEMVEDGYKRNLFEPQKLDDIPRKKPLVYILTYSGKPIVVGRGTFNRAKVIFDDETNITGQHIKAFFVRCYRLFGNGEFKRYVIHCDSVDEAKGIERHLHRVIGGNHRELPKDIESSLFQSFPEGSRARLIIDLARESAFDALGDMRRWRRKELISDEEWRIITDGLKLPYSKE